MSKSSGTRTLCRVASLEKTKYVCPSDVGHVRVTVSKLYENPPRVGRGFHLGWARGFPRKNLVFSIFTNIYFLPSQEQSVQTGLLTVCENLAIA